jgi:hypothetical protein
MTVMTAQTGKSDGSFDNTVFDEEAESRVAESAAIAAAAAASLAETRGF